MVLFYAKVIRTPNGVLVNICDQELLGKEFREGEVVLRVTSSFYGEELIGEDRAIELLHEGDLISLVGERVISLAISVGYADESHPKRVEGIPYLNIYKL